MNLPADYHVHSNFSPDSAVPMAAVCQQAIDIGLKEVCFTDHYESNPVSRLECSLDPVQYLKEIDHCRELFRDRLVIKAGLELGEPYLYQKGLQNLADLYPFDYLLGSIHWLGAELIGEEYLSQRDFDQACREYLQLVYENAKAGPFHCVGHLDMVKRHATPYFHRPFVYQDYREEVEIILRTLVENGRGLEVNCSGWRQGIGEPYPGLEIIKRYRQLGGEIITLGSDSHRLPQLGSNLVDGLLVIQEAGYRAVTVFTGGKPDWQDI